jgi:hypothetical protein
VLLKVVYLLTCRVPGLAVLVFRGDMAKDAELLVLRHENAVLRRRADRVRTSRGGPGLAGRAGATRTTSRPFSGFCVPPHALLLDAELVHRPAHIALVDGQITEHLIAILQFGDVQVVHH